jgi:hypothetical protein
MKEQRIISLAVLLLTTVSRETLGFLALLSDAVIALCISSTRCLNAVKRVSRG